MTDLCCCLLQLNTPKQTPAILKYLVTKEKPILILILIQIQRDGRKHFIIRMLHRIPYIYSSNINRDNYRNMSSKDNSQKLFSWNSKTLK